MTKEFKVGSFYKLFSLGRALPHSPYIFKGETEYYVFFENYIEGKPGRSEESGFPRVVIDSSEKYSPEELSRVVNDLRKKASWLEGKLKGGSQSQPKLTPSPEIGLGDDEASYSENMDRGLTSENF